ncbi:MAG: endolytic transglycosylase MltG [Candidatus Scatovivens sp.]
MKKIGKLAKIIIITIIILIILFLILLFSYKNSLKPVNSEENGQEIILDIPDGYGVSQISKLLKKNNVIKNDLSFKIYLKLNETKSLQAGKYCFNNGREDVKDIIEKLANGEVFKEEITITFIEGKNMRNVAKVIAEKTTNTEEDVFSLLEDKEYIDSLIEKYWFLTNEIKDENIYYPLEGYLLPDTYNFENKNVSVETIFNVILNFMDKYLSQYKEEIENSKLTVHQLLTLASMTELEGKSDEDRAKIIGVFYNRINNKMNLGSDVTTYYAFKVDMGERDLTTKEINTYNPYNTRGPNMNGKIPIGPISNPSKSAINATLNRKDTDAYYFVADKNGKVYFTKTYEEHTKKINELKEKDLWYVYD